MAVVRIRRVPGPLDSLGDPTDGTEDRLTLPGAFTAPRTTRDITDPGRQGVIVGISLYARYDADVVHTDQIEADGVLYEADGEAGRWKQPWSGWEAGCEIALVRAAG